MTRSVDAILGAAAEVAGSRGYSRAAIEEVAAQAGVAKQTIYRRWPSKAALFLDVYQWLVPQDQAADDTGGLESDLRALLAKLSALYSGTPAGSILSGLIAEAQADPVVAQQLRDTYVLPRRAILRTVFDRATRRGEIGPPADPDFLSDLFSGAVWFRLLLGERKLDDDFVAALVDSLLRTARHGAR